MHWLNSHARIVCLVREFAAHRRLAANCKNPFFYGGKNKGSRNPTPPPGARVCVCMRAACRAHTTAHERICARKERPTYTSRQRDDDFHYFAGTRGKSCSTSATSPSVSRISYHDNRELTDERGCTSAGQRFALAQSLRLENRRFASSFALIRQIRTTLMFICIYTRNESSTT